MSASRGGVVFSHLFFTDDLILFAKADVKNCLAIKDVLDTFCMFSGQKFSAKSLRCFFPLIWLNTEERNYATY